MSTYFPQKTYDPNYTRLVGWPSTTAVYDIQDGTYIKDMHVSEGTAYSNLYSDDNLNAMSRKITQLLQGVNPEGRDIIVPKDTIADVMYNIFINRTQKNVGDIYSRYIISGIEETRNDTRDIIDRTIEVIVSQIRTESEVIENNKKLTIWTSLYGDFNAHGLRQTPPIKVRKHKKPAFQFNMNY